MSEQTIESWNELQDRVRSILEALNADQELALAAAANPLYALEEVGYGIQPEARPEIEERLRFSTRTAARLRQLRGAIEGHVGRHVDVSDSGDMGSLLFDELDLPLPERVNDQTGARQGAQQGPRREEKDEKDGPLRLDPLPVRMSWMEEVKDPLEELRGEHPVVGPLLEYRRLEASRPRFAPRTIYEQIRRGERILPIRRIEGRLTADQAGAGDSEWPVDVNVADAETLVDLPGVGPILARRIVAHREREGPFASVDDLDDVEGVGEGLLERIRPHVEASP